jgi:phytoene dehydrogenase-like protein
MDDPSLLIIGSGFAGISAGIYAQMNGYQSHIYEMGEQPGGLCTAWKRKGYTIDGCVHWLVGSSPKSSLHRLWSEVGLMQERQFVDLDQYMRFEGADGRTFVIYTDVNQLERQMLELSPDDAAITRRFIDGIRLGIAYDRLQVLKSDNRLQLIMKRLRMGLLMVRKAADLQIWLRTTAEEFADRFADPLIRQALLEMWFPEFSMFFVLFTLAYLHNHNAGYPLGGSLPMSKAMEQRYLALGGQIHYRSRVQKILVENNQAVGIQLAGGVEVRAGRVISAADGHTTIFSLLDGKYADDKVREPYEKWPVFPPLLFVGLGVKRAFDDVPHTVSGISIPLQQPVEIGDKVYERLPVHIYNHDPSLAPQGKTSVVVMLPSSYQYWKDLEQDPAAYEEKKDQVARILVSLLDQRFPGLSDQVEMVDVATPLTLERYTGNWQGSFEGWLITPQNAQTVMRPMSQALPGLANFLMCGQWVEPGGGLPTALISGRRAIQSFCKEDGKEFESSLP